MASEIRVNKITHTAGVGTITSNADGIVVAGTYLVQTQLMFSYNTGGSNIQFVVFQYKNGSEYAYNTQDQQRGSGLVSNVICQSLMTFNGSSDYVEMYAKHNGGGNAIWE